MTKYLPFIFDDNNFLTNQKCFIITGEKIAFLTAFFNSSLFKFCFRDSFPELQGGTRELSKIFFERIPVIDIDKIVNEIFYLKILEIQEEKQKHLKTTDLEKEVDDMIFDLYNLTKDERKSIYIKLQ